MSRYRRSSAGSEAAPGALPLVIVPGLAAAIDAWEPVIVAARARGPVAVFDPDQWGGAGAKDGAGQATLADLTAGLTEVMDALGLATAHVLGHSLGGMVALDFVLRHPSRVGALILMSTTPEPMPDEQQRRALDLIERLDTGGDGPGQIYRWMPEATDTFSLAQQSAMRALSRAKQSALRDVSEGVAQSMHASRQAAHALITRPDQTPHLGGITAPTLVMVGEMDGPPLQRGAELLHGWIPTSRLVRIEGAGHHPHVDQPDDVERLVLSFIDEVEAAHG